MFPSKMPFSDFERYSLKTQSKKILERNLLCSFTVKYKLKNYRMYSH